MSLKTSIGFIIFDYPCLWKYPLVMTFTVRHGRAMALIEIDDLPIKHGDFPPFIDDLPFLIAWWILTHGVYVSHNQMVYFCRFF